ncbi:MAG: hypothetical protein ACYDHN_12120 [Solirubrobacteraceae bacterium]
MDEQSVPPLDNSWDPVLVELNAAAREHRERVLAARKQGGVVSALVRSAAEAGFDVHAIAAVTGIEDDLISEMVRAGRHQGARQNGH